eukprot:UN10525
MMINMIGGGLFGARQVISPAMMICRKLEALKERIEEYKQEKLSGNMIFEIKQYSDWKSKNKTKQLIVVNMVEMLKEMKELSERYFKDYVFENEWAHHLLDVFSKVEFGHEQWDAFGLYRQQSDKLITNANGSTIITRNILGAFNDYKENTKTKTKTQTTNTGNDINQ